MNWKRLFYVGKRQNNFSFIRSIKCGTKLWKEERIIKEEHIERLQHNSCMEYVLRIIDIQKNNDDGIVHVLENELDD